MDSAAIRAEASCCAHCGLPVTAVPDPSGDVFCCHACRLVSLIVGRQDEADHSWNLLRLGFGSLLAMNIMMISLLLYTGSIEAQTVPVFRRVMLVMAVPALTVLIPPFLAGASREIRSGKMSLDTLIAGGSLSAFAVSVFNAVCGTGEVYFDTATMIPVLVTVGKIIEASAKSKAANLLRSLETLLPATALRVETTGVDEVPLDALRRGDRVRIRPGERVAVDGKVLEGSSSIQEAAFTGEFLPRLCRPGDSVIAGTVNGNGSLLVEAERTGEKLLLHGIIDMIQDAWRNRSRSERIAERAATVFIPVVIAIALASLLCWAMSGSVAQGLLSALSVLVVACPCTMGIATPLATSLAVVRAAKAGVIIRGGCVMEEMAGTQMIFFDKTGTITQGSPVVREVLALDPGVDRAELLGRLATLESASEHPLGRAVIEQAREEGIEVGSASDVFVTPGCGLAGAVTWRDQTREVKAGSEGFIDGAQASAEGSGTVIDVAWDGVLRGRICLADAIRPDAASCVRLLSQQEVACVLLSGDRLPAAMAVAAEVGVKEVYASRSPAEKVEAVSSAAAAGVKVAMVGDGINDAPALAAAHTGIAFGNAMDLPRLAGNAVILSGRLMQIPWLIGLSRRTMQIVRGNFTWSFLYNAVALAAAAAGLLHPLLAALLMVVSSVTVLGNSLRIVSFPGLEEWPDPASSAPGGKTGGHRLT